MFGEELDRKFLKQVSWFAHDVSIGGKLEIRILMKLHICCY